MNENANPIDFLIEFAWANGADRFVVNNAKDELKQLRQQIDQYKNFFPVAWGKTNSRGDLYDLRTQDNPYTSDEICVPLYSNRVEFKDFYSKYRKQYG
jgi:chorismate mutase